VLYAALAMLLCLPCLMRN